MGGREFFVGLPVAVEDFSDRVGRLGFRCVRGGSLPQEEWYQHRSGVSLQVYQVRGEPSGGPLINGGFPLLDGEGYVVKMTMGLEDPLRGRESQDGVYLCTKVKMSVPGMSRGWRQALMGVVESFPDACYASLDGGVKPLSALVEEYGVRR